MAWYFGRRRFVRRRYEELARDVVGRVEQLVGGAGRERSGKRGERRADQEEAFHGRISRVHVRCLFRQTSRDTRNASEKSATNDG